MILGNVSNFPRTEMTFRNDWLVPAYIENILIINDSDNSYKI